MIELLLKQLSYLFTKSSKRIFNVSHNIAEETTIFANSSLLLSAILRISDLVCPGPSVLRSSPICKLFKKNYARLLGNTISSVPSLSLFDAKSVNALHRFLTSEQIIFGLLYENSASHNFETINNRKKNITIVVNKSVCRSSIQAPELRLINLS